MNNELEDETYSRSNVDRQLADLRKEVPTTTIYNKINIVMPYGTYNIYVASY